LIITGAKVIKKWLSTNRDDDIWKNGGQNNEKGFVVSRGINTI
jgi:hypothetical protein